MGQKSLIDTNILIDAFGNAMPIPIRKFVAQLEPIISAVTYIETLGWHKATPDQLIPIKEFMNEILILPIDQPVIEKTIYLKQNHKIKLGDALIAATALVHNLDLITRNVKDFENIVGLKVTNPWNETLN